MEKQSRDHVTGQYLPGHGALPAQTSSRIIRMAFAILTRRDSMNKLAKRNNISFVTLSHWKHGKSSPRLADFEAVLESEGYRLSIERIPRT